MFEKPVWLHEQPDILKVLNLFIDKLDKKPLQHWSQPPAISVNHKTLPGLFNQGEQADQTWALLKSLSKDYGVFSIRLHKKRNPLDPEYCNARIRFQGNAEGMLRAWLRRPYEVPALQQWRRAVEQAGDSFVGDTAKLSSRPISLSDKSAEQIVQAFARIGDYQQHNLTLRQLSALCFWGRSKFLDGRIDLVLSLFPQIKLNQRPIVVNIYLPQSITGILFIENQDSYTCAMRGRPLEVQDLALVYCAGFKGSALRIRDKSGVALHFSGPGAHQHQHQFEQHWYDESLDQWPLWFWGDLDFAGMSILKQLINRFPHIRAWQPGYQFLLSHLQTGNGYEAGSEEQQFQIDPQSTGCAYADEYLLPALRRYGLFVDQEIVY
ncbi:Wadjet anti-phage system protein JetD domain-containing protein [Kaarinaea lacus]